MFLRWSGLFTSIMDLVRSILKVFLFSSNYFYRGSSQSLVWVKIIRRVQPCLSNQKIRNSKDDIYFLQFIRSEFDRDFLSARLHFERDLSVRLRFIIYDYDYIVKDEENIATACTNIEHYAGKSSNESWDSVLQRLKAKDIKDCCQPNGHLILLDQTTKSWWLQWEMWLIFSTTCPQTQQNFNTWKDFFSLLPRG